MEAFHALAATLNRAGVRYLLIGVAGANYWARRGSEAFVTQNRDLFLPAEPDNVLRAWGACESAGFSRWAGQEPLDLPRDRALAEQIVGRRAQVSATDGRGLDVDLTLVMAGFTFDEVWSERRVFLVEDVELPVARLLHIVQSKSAAGREKDRLFLATHAEALKDLLIEGD
jgi:hypothetical protein